MWVRGNWAADCITRTTNDRADSIYFTRGVLGFELFTIPDELGWRYDRAEPGDFPRSAGEIGVPAAWSFLGAQYAPAARLILVPMWVPAAATALAAAWGWRRRVRSRRSR